MQEPNRLERVSDFQLLKHKVYEVIKGMDSLRSLTP